jgi:hypothetical protein
MTTLSALSTTSSHAFFPSTGLRLAGLLVLALTLGAASGPQTAAAQSTFTVTSNGTADDFNAGDGVCDTNDSQGDGPCTLRAAIQEANSDGANDTIEFDIPNSGTFTTISAKDEFVIDEPVTIDGTTSPTYPGFSGGTVDGPTIAVDGANLSSSVKDGFEIQADGVTIKALGVNRFPDEGIQVFDRGTNATIANCYVGLAIDDGSTDRGNSRNSDGSTDAGVAITGDGYSVKESVIAHNQSDGMYLNATRSSSNAATVELSLVGVDATEENAAGNDGAGIRIDGGSAHQIEATVVAGNTGSGIVAEAPSLIKGAQVGYTAKNIGEIPNGLHGIEVLADEVVVEVNIISGNDLNGIQIGSNSVDVNGITIQENTIGLDAARSFDVPNGDGTDRTGGIVCQQSTATGSGNTSVIRDNEIAGNDGSGILLTSGCLDWDLQDNLIGTNSSFASGLGNAERGIDVEADPGGAGGETQIDENVIVSSGLAGILLTGSFHDVTDNYVGVTPDGTKLGNVTAGIVAFGGGSTVENVAIGRGTSLGDGSVEGTSTPTGTGNVVGDNGGGGILLTGDVTNAFVRENYVGTTPGGVDVANASDGIQVVEGSATTTDHIIGVDEGETPGGASGATSPDPADGGRGNVIAYNSGDAVSVGASESSNSANRVSIRGNVTYQNGGNEPQLGIDLGNSGTTTNDDANDDADDGPNNLQNFPIVESTSYDNSNDQVSITYRVQTTTTNAAYPLKIDFYAADTEGSGEGKTYLGTQEYQSGDATTSKTNVIDLGNYPNVSSDDYFVATATDANGNTSEFTATANQLPVELASFEARRAGSEQVALSWQTASETNNAGFRVERQQTGAQTAAGSGDSWEQVGYVESKAPGGTTTEALDYRFQDREVPFAADTIRYRLTQVDTDGSTSRSNVVEVALGSVDQLTLKAPYPNPARGDVTVKLAVPQAKSGSAQLRLYNALGQQVQAVRVGEGGRQRVEVQTDGLASGVYFLRLTAGEATKTRRVTVVR